MNRRRLMMISSIAYIIHVILRMPVPFAGSKNEGFFWVTFRQAQRDTGFVILSMPVPFAGSKDDEIIFNHTLTGLV